MARPKGETKAALTVRIPVRLGAAIERRRAAWERARRRTAGPGMPPPSVADWIAYVVEMEVQR